MHWNCPEAFYTDLELLSEKVYADRRPEDIDQLRNVEWWGRICSIVGYAFSWVSVNPIAILGIGLGLSCRWMIVAHHVLHKGFDQYPNAPNRLKSSTFAKGWRRYIDWFDWIPVKAWSHEHNVLHHYRLGEIYDPDVPESNLTWLASLRVPNAIKYSLLVLIGMTWKWGYYGPNTLQTAARSPKETPKPYDPFAPASWSPWHPMGRQVWLQSWLPQLLIRFGFIPALALPFGSKYALAIFLNTIFADLFTNLHTFFVIVPNHCGEDIPRFDCAPKDKREHRLRQILGSANYSTGSDFNDFFHGWLNYQIEHHVWPDLSLGQYQRWQPELKALCEKHNVRYLQEPIWTRIVKMARNVVGNTEMLKLSEVT